MYNHEKYTDNILETLQTIKNTMYSQKSQKTNLTKKKLK